MNRVAVGAAVVALGALVGPARADEGPAAPAPYKAPWYKQMFGIGPNPPPQRPVKRDPALEAANARAAAEADYSRRMWVCLELRQIASETENTGLEAKVQELEQKAWEVYRRQTAHLPCNRLVVGDDERAIGSRLGGAPSATIAADRLELPRGTETGRRAQASIVREVKP